MFNRVYWIAWFVIPVCACSGFRKPLIERPSWVVTGKSDRYPASRYFTGIGQARERTVAEDRARAQISKVFESRIKSVSQDEMASWQSFGADKTDDQIHSEETFSRQTKITTEKTIRGIEIVESVQNGDLFYALAVLDRYKMAQRLTDEMMVIDARVHDDIAAANHASTKVDRIKYLSRAVNGLVKRDALNARLRVVSPTGDGIASPVQLSEVVVARNQAVNQNFSVKVVVTGDANALVAEALVETLTRMGFRIETDAQQPADIEVRGKVEIAPMVHPLKEWQWMRFSGEFHLVDGQTGKILGSTQFSGKKPHLTRDGAWAKATKAVQEAMSTQVRARIAEFLFQ